MRFETARLLVRRIDAGDVDAMHAVYGDADVVERRAMDVIGFCGLVHPNGQPDAEIKYALRREQWGQGFASEAAAGLLEWQPE